MELSVHSESDVRSSAHILARSGVVARSGNRVEARIALALTTVFLALAFAGPLSTAAEGGSSNAVAERSATTGAERDFGGYWHDGKAEIDGYRLTVLRYGEPRSGTAVMIYVTEPFSESKRVKVDDANANPEDTFDAFKLNIVRDFQTGIYDYNTMVSVFVRTSDLSPVKLSFGSQEWCGNVYEELLFYPEEIKGHYSSYFENESGDQRIDNFENGVAEDQLYILLRSLLGDFVKPGSTLKVKLLPSVFYGRLSHKPLEWVDAEIFRNKDTMKLVVPAGAFETVIYELKTSDGRKGTFFIDTEYPHRIVRWEMPPDVRGELTGSKRLEYWKLHDNGDEAYLKDIGLR